MHIIAAKAVAFSEALRPEFKTYSKNIVDNAKTLATTLLKRGYQIVSGGTETHLILLDLRSKGLKGNAAENSLENSAITCNKNSIPFDPEKPTVTSGIRLGTPACTTRGFGPTEFNKVGNLIADVLEGLISNPEDNTGVEKAVMQEVLTLCNCFPIYPDIKE